MEEDIKILEEMLEEGFEAMCTLEAKAIENILTDYKQKLDALDKNEKFIKDLGKEIDRLKEENKTLKKYDIRNIKIEKDKILKSPSFTQKEIDLMNLGIALSSSFDKILKMEENREMGNIEVKKLDLQLKEGHAVCFDFDGVIHKYSKGWQDGSIYDEYNKEVLNLMLFMQKSKIPVFICSTREPMQIINWWNKQGFWTKATLISENETFWKDTTIIGVTNKKLPAQLYIDDRAYKYTGQTVKQFILDNSIEIE